MTASSLHRKAVQAKHITTEAFLDAVRADRQDGWVDGQPWTHACAQSVAMRLGVPTKVVGAKITKLERQGVLWGSCGCGCGSPILLAEDRC